MDRNFFRRIETGFPLLDPKLKRRVINEGLKAPLKDNMRALGDAVGRWIPSSRQTRQGFRCPGFPDECAGRLGGTSGTNERAAANSSGNPAAVSRV
jgi:hypothetical protein